MSLSVLLVRNKVWRRPWTWSNSDRVAPGWGSGRRQISRAPAGQPLRPVKPHSSTTCAPLPSVLMAGRHDVSGAASIISRVVASIANPTENAMFRSARSARNVFVTPALSARTSSGWATAPGSSPRPWPAR